MLYWCDCHSLCLVYWHNICRRENGEIHCVSTSRYIYIGLLLYRYFVEVSIAQSLRCRKENGATHLCTRIVPRARKCAVRQERSRSNTCENLKHVIVQFNFRNSTFFKTLRVFPWRRNLSMGKMLSTALWYKLQTYNEERHVQNCPWYTPKTVLIPTFLLTLHRSYSSLETFQSNLQVAKGSHLYKVHQKTRLILSTTKDPAIKHLPSRYQPTLEAPPGWERIASTTNAHQESP